MNLMQYPRGDARAIADARARGLKPAGAVEVVLAGGWFDSPNPVVYADDHDRIYRWDWLAGLYVVLVVNSKTRLDRILAGIDRANPAQIDVIDRERRLGWMVTYAKPRIKTIRWPSAWVADWLDAGNLHLELSKAKGDAIQAEQVRRASKPKLQPEFEIPWN